MDLPSQPIELPKSVPPASWPFDWVHYFKVLHSKLRRGKWGLVWDASSQFEAA